MSGMEEFVWRLHSVGILCSTTWGNWYRERSLGGETSNLVSVVLFFTTVLMGKPRMHHHIAELFVWFIEWGHLCWCEFKFIISQSQVRPTNFGRCRLHGYVPITDQIRPSQILAGMVGPWRVGWHCMPSYQKVDGRHIRSRTRCLGSDLLGAKYSSLDCLLQLAECGNLTTEVSNETAPSII